VKILTMIAPLALAIAFVPAAAASLKQPPDPLTDVVVADVPVLRFPDRAGVFFVAKLAIDSDGSPHSYHPDDTGLDWLRNGGNPETNTWWGVYTDKDGKPVVQGPNDPAPGYYVSTTTLTDTSVKNPADPRRYVDAEKVPFVVVPPAVMEKCGVKMGDFAFVANLPNNRATAAIVADIGPKTKIGEGSMALAQRLGIPNSPKTGGADGGVAYLLFPASGNGSARSLSDIESNARRLLKQWGGESLLRRAASTAEPKH
jgi:hypothetical protein